MGIPSCRFLDRNHDQFTCPICLEVAADPVAVNGCDHIFCQTCIDSDELKKCPTCQVGFKNPKWNEIERISRRIYLDLRMKCLNPSCDETLTPSDYKNHDENCPITFDTCKDCGFKVHRGSNNDHSCIKVLKAELMKTREEIEEKRERIVTFERPMISNMALITLVIIGLAIVCAVATAHVNLTKAWVEKGLREEIENREIMMKNERERMENLIYFCVKVRDYNINHRALGLDGLSHWDITSDRRKDIVKWCDKEYEEFKNRNGI